MNDGSCMMFPNKYGGLTRYLVNIEILFLFKKKEIEAVVDYMMLVMVIMPFCVKMISGLKIMMKPHSKDFGKCSLMVLPQKLDMEQVWFLKILKENCILMHFDYNLNVQIMRKEYEALIQGLILSHQMEIIDLIVMGDS
jgi:hypothetical protein